MAQGGRGIIPSGDKFLCHEALISCLYDGAHHGGIIDFLRVVQLTAAGIARGMVMPNHILILPNAADHVAIHDLHMVHVEQQFHVGRINFSDEFHTVIDILAEVAGMAFHWV